jgi:hypothetical protein
MYEDIEPPMRKPEFNPDNTKERAEQLQAEANAQTIGGTCVFCHNKVFWLPGDRAQAKGQVYSDSGRDEFRISQMCEWCFDECTLDKEDNPELYAHYHPEEKDNT